MNCPGVEFVGSIEKGKFKEKKGTVVCSRSPKQTIFRLFDVVVLQGRAKKCTKA